MTPTPATPSIVNNATKWTLAVVGAACTGILSCLIDPNSHHQLWDFLRAAAIVELPTIGALVTTLKKDLGIL
jgi:hypothetical protein